MGNSIIHLLQLCFWLSVFFIFSTYLGYPLVLLVLRRIKKVTVRKDRVFQPLVSVIISAFNEEKNIEKKILNTLSSKYPTNKLEIIVGSDGSIDKTVQIARKYESNGVKILDFKTNSGKTSIQNACVKEARGEIIIFTDAASFISPNSISEICKNFAEQQVGCVAGMMKYIDTDKNLTTRSQGLYWKYERVLRELESDQGRLIGVDGPLYAVRKEEFIFLKNHVISDFILPLLILAKGKKVIIEKNAIVNEVPTQEGEDELNTRRRITLRGLVGLKEHHELLNVFRHPLLSLQIYFHKLIRWFVGPLIILNFIATLILSHILIYKLFLIFYFIFIFGALVGIVLEKFQIKFKILMVPYYFILVNYAATLGIIDFLLRKQAIKWQPVRK